MKFKFIIIIIAIVLIAVSVILWFQFSYLKILPKAAGFQKPMTYLVLLQNNYEIRATGGYIGSFAIATVDHGKINKMELFNTNEFDAKSAVKANPPAPLKDFLGVNNWQLRDVNWSPDFPTTANLAIQFYNLESNSQKEFDGVIAINANMLPAILELVGSVKINGVEFNKDNAALALEYELEQGFYKKGIPQQERKAIFYQFIKEVMERIEQFSPREKIKLARILEKHLNQKDVLIYFSDKKLEDVIKKNNWAGNTKDFSRDYLMVIDSNLGAFKSDLFVTRGLEYHVDLTDPVKPKARLTINYTHQAKQENWLVKDYRDFLQVFTPERSILQKVGGVSNKTTFENDKNNVVFGNFIEVPLNQKKKIVYDYILPPDVLRDNVYELLIQKQSGIKNLPVKIIVSSPLKTKRLWPNNLGWIVAGKNQTVFESNLNFDMVFRIKFDN